MFDLGHRVDRAQKGCGRWFEKQKGLGTLSVKVNVYGRRQRQVK